MTVVVDASVVVKWFVDEPGAERAAALRSEVMIAPDLILVEVGNALWKLQRRGILTTEDYGKAVEALGAAPLTLAPVPELLLSAARLAAELDHPLDDCRYLALAMREGRPLVTDDRRLLAVAGLASADSFASSEETQGVLPCFARSVAARPVRRGLWRTGPIWKRIGRAPAPTSRSKGVRVPMTTDYPMVDVVKVKPMEAFRLWVRFSDGSEGGADLSGLLARTGPMVAPFSDQARFSRVFVEAGVPTWPNGYDNAPSALYEPALRA